MKKYNINDHVSLYTSMHGEIVTGLIVNDRKDWLGKWEYHIRVDTWGRDPSWIEEKKIIAKTGKLRVTK